MIPGLPSIGGGEILILLAIVLLFFGAKRIPELARSLGRGTHEFRKGISEGTSSENAQSSEEEREKAAPSTAGDRESPDVKSEASATAEHKA